MAHVQPNVGLRACKRAIREAKVAASSQRVRASKAGFQGAELVKYNRIQGDIETLTEQLAACKAALK